VNPFTITGIILDGAGTACMAAGLALSGEARAPLLITAAPLMLTGVIFVLIGVRLGKILGRSPRILRFGTPATATVLRIGETSVTINNAPVFEFDLEVERPEGSTYRASLKQVVPRMLVGAVLPGHRVAVKFDEAAPDNLAIDWSVPPRPEELARPAPELKDEVDIDLVARENRRRAADLLAHGRRGTGRITSAKEMGTLGDLGLAEAGEEGSDDQAVLFGLDVKLPGRSPFSTSVLHRVPGHLTGRVGPGLEVEVAADRDDPQHQIAIDWSLLAL